MGQQKLRKVRYTNTQSKNIPKLNSEPVRTLPGPYNSYPKVGRSQPKPTIVRYLHKSPTATLPYLTKNLERPKAARDQKPLKSTKARNQSESIASSIFARSLPTYSEFEFKYTNNKTTPVPIKTTKFVNPKSIKPGEIGTKKIPKENFHKDLQCLPRTLQYHRRDDQKIMTNSKKLPIVKPALMQSVSTPSKGNRSVEIKKRESINKSKKLPAQFTSPKVVQDWFTLSKQSFDTKNQQKKPKKVPKTKSNDLPKRKNYPIHIGFQDQRLGRIEVSRSPKWPGKLRSILKNSMNYSQIKKLDDDSLQHITEGKGPVDECLCDLLSTSESKGRGIKASIRRAFASFSGSKKKGGGVQNSVDIPISFTQGGKGGIYSTKEELKRKTPCGKCGCDKNPVVLKHSYANIRITTPDLATICSCPENCFPDKDKYNGKVRVTVERMAALNSDDSELSLLKRTQQLAIPEPMMEAAMETLGPIMAPGGDAQPANLYCRLCGATGHLHDISDDQVDQTLQGHFGFTTPPTGFICNSCKNYLKITVGFSALVEASLSGSNSKSKDLLENADTLTSTSSMNTAILAAPTPGKTDLAQSNQEILSLLQSPVKNPRRRRRRIINVKNSPTVIRKRVITQCVQCGHKYPAMVRSDSVLQYVCSRCNQKNQIKEGQNNGKLENQKRFRLKGKIRQNSLSKTTQQVKPIMPSKTRLKTPKPCPKEVSNRTRQVHKGGSVLTWDKKVTDNLAGQGSKYGRYLEQHIKANKSALINHEKPGLHTKNWH